MTLTITARNVPHKTAFFRWTAGSLRHATAITTALSPLSTILIVMMSNSDEKNVDSSKLYALLLPLVLSNSSIW